MKRIVIISFHAAYWLAYLFFTVSIVIVARGNFNGNVFESIVLNTFLAGSCFYAFYFSLVPKYLSKRQIKKFVAWGLLTTFVIAIVMMTLLVLSGVKNKPTLEFTETQTALFPIIFNLVIVVAFYTVIGLVHGLLATFMKGFFLWYNDIFVKQQLEKKNLETQMSLIKARIDPHFLFNTLHNIDTLIKNDPSLASIYLQKLCTIMRFTLYENQVELTPLQKEIDVMQEYIALERLRCANDFILVEITGELTDVGIAPMVLLTFVENAIKFSDGRKTENAVRVKVHVHGDGQLDFFCRNIIAKKSTEPSGGIGLELIKNRLNLLYPNKHVLLLSEKDGYFEVKLTVTTK